MRHDRYMRLAAMPPRRRAAVLIGDHDQARRVLDGGTDMPALTFRPISEYLPKPLAA